MDLLGSGNVRPRKPHQCWHCRETVPAGSYTYTQRWAEQGKAYTIYLHLDCHHACCACDHWHWGECTGGECKRGKGPE